MWLHLPVKRMLSGVLVTSLIAGAGGGCASVTAPPDATYCTVPRDEIEGLAAARELNNKGLQAFRRGHLDAAEKHLRQALSLDTNFGPAHNNLGQVYLARNQLYLAAWEFELAANLMPQRVEPLVNLGLVYELAVQMERAEQYYREALQVAPTHADALGSLARLLVKQQGDPIEIHQRLKELVFVDDRPQWHNWAQRLLATTYREDGFVELAADGLDSDVPLLRPDRENHDDPATGFEELPPPAADPTELQSHNQAAARLPKVSLQGPIAEFPREGVGQPLPNITEVIRVEK